MWATDENLEKHVGCMQDKRSKSSQSVTFWFHGEFIFANEVTNVKHIKIQP